MAKSEWPEGIVVWGVMDSYRHLGLVMWVLSPHWSPEERQLKVEPVYFFSQFWVPFPQTFPESSLCPSAQVRKIRVGGMDDDMRSASLVEIGAKTAASYEMTS